MAWSIEGHYFESCSCAAPCPCTVSLALGADKDYCRVLLAFQVDSGEVDGVDVSGLGVAVVGDSPKFMLEGNWKLGLLVDERASDEQAEKLGGVFSGALGGPMAGLAPLISEMRGVERAALQFGGDGLTHSVRADDVEVEVEDVVPFGVESGEAAKLVGIFHPANSTLTVAKAKRARVDRFGIEFEGDSAFSAPFAWSG
jgi:hypothetical protein